MRGDRNDWIIAMIKYASICLIEKASFLVWKIQDSSLRAKLQYNSLCAML